MEGLSEIELEAIFSDGTDDEWDQSPGIQKDTLSDDSLVYRKDRGDQRGCGDLRDQRVKGQKSDQEQNLFGSPDEYGIPVEALDALEHEWGVAEGRGSTDIATPTIQDDMLNMSAEEMKSFLEEMDESHPSPHHGVGGSHPSSYQGVDESHLSHQGVGKHHPSPHQSVGEHHPSPHQSVGQSHPSPHQSVGQSHPSPHQSVGEHHPSPHQSVGESHPLPHQSVGESHPLPHQSVDSFTVEQFCISSSEMDSFLDMEQEAKSTQVPFIHNLVEDKTVPCAQAPTINPDAVSAMTLTTGGSKFDIWDILLGEGETLEPSDHRPDENKSGGHEHREEEEENSSYDCDDLELVTSSQWDAFVNQ